MSGPTPLPVFCFRFCGESFAFFRLFNPAKAVAAVDIDSVTSGDFYTSELGFRIVDLKTTAFAWRNWIWSQKSLMNKFKSLFVFLFRLLDGRRRVARLLLSDNVIRHEKLFGTFPSFNPRAHTAK